MTTTPAGSADESRELREVKVEALQAVVDRVTSWQESAPEGTIREELDAALVEVGLDLDEGVKRRIVHQIRDDERVDVRALLS